MADHSDCAVRWDDGKTNIVSCRDLMIVTGDNKGKATVAVTSRCGGPHIEDDTSEQLLRYNQPVHSTKMTERMTYRYLLLPRRTDHSVNSAKLQI